MRRRREVSPSGKVHPRGEESHLVDHPDRSLRGGDSHDSRPGSWATRNSFAIWKASCAPLVTLGGCQLALANASSNSLPPGVPDIYQGNELWDLWPGRSRQSPPRRLRNPPAPAQGNDRHEAARQLRAPRGRVAEALAGAAGASSSAGVFQPPSGPAGRFGLLLEASGDRRDRLIAYARANGVIALRSAARASSSARTGPTLPWFSRPESGSTGFTGSEVEGRLPLRLERFVSEFPVGLLSRV